jgi:RimJ/RimL family protein N-acetyltransferase
MILYTERLKLQFVKENDIDDIHRLHSLPETNRYNTLGKPKDKDETIDLINFWIEENARSKSSKLVFAIHLNESNQFIGLIGINFGKEHYKNAEIWFKFDVKYWNQGFATETVHAILDFGFNTCKLHRIEAGCAIDNIGSYKVLEKVGMLREAHTRQLLPLQSGWSDNYGYAILSTDKRKKTIG